MLATNSITRSFLIGKIKNTEFFTHIKLIFHPLSCEHFQSLNIKYLPEVKTLKSIKIQITIYQLKIMLLGETFLMKLISSERSYWVLLFG